MDVQLPQSFIDHLVERRGAEAEQWLTNLPTIIQKCAEEWRFTLQQNTYDLYTNYICPIRMSDGKEAVLKIGFPGDEGVRTEIEALQCFSPQHSVLMFQYASESLTFLIERLNPGTALRDIHMENDAEATQIALPLLQNVMSPVPMKHSLPTLSNWAKVIAQTKDRSIEGNITPEILDTALEIFTSLDESKEEEMLLHGDLHHDNILLDDIQGWKAIDPKGVIGDPAYNASRFIINNWSSKNTADLLPDRIVTISDALGYTKERVAGWAYVDLVISNCWSVEDGSESTIDLDSLITLQSLIR